MTDPAEPTYDRDLPDAVRGSLEAGGMLAAGEQVSVERLTGGVSSDIWKVEAARGAFCVKRALAKLKVEADWRAPVDRNQNEVAWYRIANGIVPGVAPEIMHHDREAMLFAMSFLDPSDHKLWKSELRDGRADPDVAAELGRRMVRIHAGTAGDPAVTETFPDDAAFVALRMEAYLEATANKHPDLKDALFGLSQRTRGNKLVMVHGDISPKNILVGPDGPVILDAECATIGDPAFDLAFCLNHFLLKCLWTPSATESFFACFRAMSASYLEGVTWESRDALEGRVATLLPGLFLARVDGKSPVEYLTQEAEKDKVRRAARDLLFVPQSHLDGVLTRWKKELET